VTLSALALLLNVFRYYLERSEVPWKLGSCCVRTAADMVGTGYLSEKSPFLSSLDLVKSTFINLNLIY